MFTFEDNTENKKGFDIRNENGELVGTLSLLQIGKLDDAKDGSYFTAFYRMTVEVEDDEQVPSYDDLYEFCYELFYMDTNRAGGLLWHRVSLFKDEGFGGQLVVGAHYWFDV